MKPPTLTEPEIEEFLKGKWVAKLATVGKDGTPRISAYWFEYRKDHLVVNTWERTVTVSNLKKNNKASLLVDSTEYPYKAVQFYGEAKADERDSTKEEMAQLFARYMGNDIAAATKYSEGLIGMGKRIFVRFYPRKKVTWDFSKS